MASQAELLAVIESVINQLDADAQGLLRSAQEYLSNEPVSQLGAFCELMEELSAKLADINGNSQPSAILTEQTGALLALRDDVQGLIGQINDMTDQIDGTLQRMAVSVEQLHVKAATMPI